MCLQKCARVFCETERTCVGVGVGVVLVGSLRRNRERVRIPPIISEQTATYVYIVVRLWRHLTC